MMNVMLNEVKHLNRIVLSTRVRKKFITNYLSMWFFGVKRGYNSYT